jgi:large subunit ribosomal protein L1
MARNSKRLLKTVQNLERTKFYPLDEAIALVKQTASAKFDESVDVAVNLGVEARKSDQSVRGSTVLPRGTGKTVRVAVFADGPDAEAATQAGADVVGMDDLAEKVRQGEFDFDIAIATPATMRVVGKLGQILGPRGLIIHCSIGKASFGAEALTENFTALLSALQKAKPPAAKGQYFKRVTLSTTMGPGVRVDRATLPL